MKNIRKFIGKVVIGKAYSSKSVQYVKFEQNLKFILDYIYIFWFWCYIIIEYKY